VLFPSCHLYEVEIFANEVYIEHSEAIIYVYDA
jgi:hypothetical protein